MKRLGERMHHGSNAIKAVRRSWVVMTVLACALAGCARPGPDVLTPTLRTVPDAKIATVYAATTRARAEPDRNVYTNAFAYTLNYGEFKISIPPGHQPGNIEWPTGAPDPAVNFATVQQSVLDRQSFAQRMATGDGAVNRAGANVFVFVHGFNTNFQEALYRLAQLKGDANVDAVPVLFSWPSEAKLVGYLADKDAVVYSRDHLVALLTMLARDRKFGNITVVAHSMGAWLTVEALRQLRLSGDNAVVSRLNVTLAAPDIDVDVFRQQMEVVGKLSPPMVILVSRDDLALAFSSRLADHRKRVGALNIDDPRVREIVAKTDIHIEDISSVKPPDSFRHNRFAALAALYPHLARDDQDWRRAGAFVLDSMGTTLAAPFSMTGRAIAGE